MELPLNGRVAIVTGSSRGIGRAIAIHLSSLGANLVVNYVTNSTQADLLVSELSSNSSTLRAIAVQADVSDPSGPKTLFDRAEEAFGSPVHIFVNSAGITDSKNQTISSMPLEEFDAIFNVNARGAFLCCQEAANRIVRGGGGRIVMITTCLVEMLVPKYGAYTASKAAAQTMARVLAKELKGTRITVNCVAPGAIATDMFFEGRTEEDIRRVAGMNAMGRLGETKDVVPVVGFLCGDEAEWVNGQVIQATGGRV
ncbi:short-chain type dehydrogenase/reductase-like [Asparagus officinalis]|nr:short-chain type dehydrogenase/reductase-like [Asparagus officinalis]